jgi:hypothetical protein
VDSGAEGEVVVAGAVDVEPVRVGEVVRVAVGGRDEGEEVLAAGDAVAADVDLGQGDAPGELERGGVAEGLVDGLARPGGVGAQGGPLVGWRSSARVPWPMRLTAFS